MNITHIGPRSLGATLQLPESLRLMFATFGITAPDFVTSKKCFSFRRWKREGVWGWSIHLHIGPLCLADIQWAPDKPFPRRRKDAEVWAIDFANRHGFVPMFRVKTKRRVPRQRLRLIQGGAA